MQQVKAVLILAATLFLANTLNAQEPAQSDFLNRITKAYLESDLDTVVGMTCWEGVSPKAKTEAIDRYKREIALTATKVELLGKEAARWHDWTKGDIAFTYNADVLHTLVIHLQPGSKVHFGLGEVPVRDIRLPVGLVDGKFYVLRGVPKKTPKPTLE